MMEGVQAVRGARSRDVRSDKGTSPEAVLEGMIQRRLLVVIRTKTPEQALAAAEAVAAGGILSLEVSVTMPDADQVIKALAPRHGLTVGAGGGRGGRWASSVPCPRLRSSPSIGPGRTW